MLYQRFYLYSQYYINAVSTFLSLFTVSYVFRYMRARYTTFLDGYCSTVRGLLDWFEVDLGFTELLFIQIDLCALCVFARYTSVFAVYVNIYMNIHTYVYIHAHTFAVYINIYIYIHTYTYIPIYI